MKAFETYLHAKAYSQKTIQAYAHDVRRFTEWLKTQNIAPEQVRYSDVLHYIQHKQATVSQSSIHSLVNSIKHYYNHLKLANQVLENPMSQIQIKGIKRKKLYPIISKPALEQLYHQYTIPNEHQQHPNLNIHPILTSKRNKVMLGLMIYQGLNTQELGKLTEHDVKLRDGKIYIAGGRKSNPRTLSLQAHQILDMMEYHTQIRPELLTHSKTKTTRFLVNSQGGNSFHSIIAYLMKQLRKQHPNISSAKQIRTSVITHWLKHHNLREVQYMAGHRYISSTEAYLINDIEGLQQDISKFHPTAENQ